MRCIGRYAFFTHSLTPQPISGRFGSALAHWKDRLMAVNNLEVVLGFEIFQNSEIVRVTFEMKLMPHLKMSVAQNFEAKF
jgi:hypothetical protein